MPSIRSLAPFIPFVAMILLLTPPSAQGQTPTPPAAVADAVDPPSGPWVGFIDVSGSTAGGTQRQHVAKGTVEIAYERPGDQAAFYSHTKFRAEGAYTLGQKPDQAAVVSTEMWFGELRQSFDGKQLLSRLGGNAAPRAAPIRLWLYAVASEYHNIAFGLESEFAYAVGAEYQLLRNRPLTIGVDFRHLAQEFRGQERFSSLAARLFETYTHQWTIGQQNDRVIVLTESVEVTSAFASANALRVRTLIKLLLPLLPKWGTTLGFGSDYMENAAPSFKQHYWKVELGFQYSFGG